MLVVHYENGLCDETLAGHGKVELIVARGVEVGEPVCVSQDARNVDFRVFVEQLKDPEPVESIHDVGEEKVCGCEPVLVLAQSLDELNGLVWP